MPDIAQKSRLNVTWHFILMFPKSFQEQYHNGFRLSYYLYKDFLVLYKDNPLKKINEVQNTFYKEGNKNSGNIESTYWSIKKGTKFFKTLFFQNLMRIFLF